MASGSWGVLSLFFRVFPVKIPAKRGKLPANRELHVVAGVAIFPTHLGSRINSLPCTEASLGSQDMILRTEAVGMFLMPRGHLLTEIPGLTGGALDDPRSCAGPQSGQKRLGQTSVKLGQLWSNLVNLGQTWSDFGKCVPDPVLRLFGVMSPRRIKPTWFGLPRFACRHPRKSRGKNGVMTPEKIPGFISVCVPALLGSKWTFRGLKKIGQDAKRRPLIDDPSSPLRRTGDDLAWGLPKSQIEWSNGLAFESKHVGEVNLRLQICSSLKLGGSTVWHLNPNTLRGDLAWGLPKSQIEWSNGLAFESKHVGDVNLRLQICSSLKLGGSTVWHLNPNTLRDDLAWGLPKSQIEWSNGLAFESKHVGDVNLRLQICSSLKLGVSTVWHLNPNTLRDVNLRLQICSSLKLGVSTVWHLNPNTLRDDLAWGLPKSQIEWSNGLAFESKHVGEVNLRLQICPSLKLGGSTVWHLNPNTLRDDLAWGLPKSQIEWSNGLAFESKHVGEVNLRLQICSSLKLGGSTVWHLNPNTLRVIWLGDYPSLKSSGPTAWHLNPNTDDLAWGLPKSQIEWSNGLAFESKHVGDVNLRLQICSSLKLGGSTVWHLNPNTLRDDLAWGLPKSQIEWSNGLAFESKHVGDVNLRLQICSSLKLGGSTTSNSVQVSNWVVSTVWHLNPNTLRDDLAWGLPKSQIEWSNGLAFESKHVGDVNLRLQICSSLKLGGSTVWHLNPNTLRDDLAWGLPKSQIEWSNGLAFESKHVGDVNLRLQICSSLKLGVSTVWHLNPNTLRDDLAWGLPKSQIECLIEMTSTMPWRTFVPRADASIARNLQAELDAEAAGLFSGAARPPPRPGVVIGRSARPSGMTRPSPQPSVTTGHSDTPSDGGIRPCYPVIVEISDTPLLTNLLAHPSSLVRRYPPESVGRGGWSEFSRLLAISHREYREFLTELGFGPFLGIPYVSVYHPSVGCFVERFFHHTGPSTLAPVRWRCFPVDWSAILGIRFGGRAPPSEPISGPEAMEILGLDDSDAIDGSRLPSVRIRYLADILRRDREEPPTELRYRQWAAYFIFSCFLGNDKSTVPTPIVGMFRDVDTLREYDWGALTYGFYIRGLRRFSCRESISFLGFWQFTIFWAFEYFPTFAPSRLPLASDPDFPLARHWDSARIRRLTSRTLLKLRTTVDCIKDADIVFQPYSPALVQHPEGEAAQREGEMAQMRADLAQRQRDLGSRDAELARLAATIRRLEDQLQGVGIPPVTGAGSSGLGQTSSSPPPDPVSRDWFFDDPPSS
uniref:Aminotransferase-like plant mobile domain-containing protein n=1 Tax=Fagus sylvatica TaxID=28930 RepID=A0A2N9HGJ3_FAGSY